LENLKKIALLRRKPYNQFSEKGEQALEFHHAKEAPNLYEGTEE